MLKSELAESKNWHTSAWSETRISKYRKHYPAWWKVPGKGTGFPNPVSHAQAAEATPPVPGRTFRNADLHERRTSSYTAHANTCRSCKYARKCGKGMKEWYPPNCDHLILQWYPIKQPFGVSPWLTSGLTFARFYSKVPKVRCRAGRQRRILGGLPSSG